MTRSEHPVGAQPLPGDLCSDCYRGSCSVHGAMMGNDE